MTSFGIQSSHLRFIVFIYMVKNENRMAKFLQPKNNHYISVEIVKELLNSNKYTLQVNDR